MTKHRGQRTGCLAPLLPSRRSRLTCQASKRKSSYLICCQSNLGRYRFTLKSVQASDEVQANDVVQADGFGKGKFPELEIASIPWEAATYQGRKQNLGLRIDPPKFGRCKISKCYISFEERLLHSSRRMAAQRTLYWGSGSTFAWRVLIALKEKGLDFESKVIEFSKSESSSSH